MTLQAELKRAWDYVSIVEPTPGLARHELDRVDGSIKSVEAHIHELDQLEGEDASDVQALLAVMYARGAAIAIAANDIGKAHDYFDEADAHAGGAYAEQLKAGRRDPERFRKLVHGRMLIANGNESRARKLWREVVKANKTDAIADAANAEQKAPRPLNGANPTLYTLNGVGAGFSGARDHWPDGSYVTTHCIKVLYIPIFPLSAFRVRDGGHNQYYIMAREQLSGFAKGWRWALLGLIVFGIAYAAIDNHFNDPDRLARNRWDDTFEHVAGKTDDGALRELDDRLADSTWRVGSERVEKAGAEIMRITLARVKSPLSVDQASAVVRRFEGLKDDAAKRGARTPLLAALDKWIADAKEPQTQLELLELAQRCAEPGRANEYGAKILTTRMAVADSQVETAPLDALAVYLEHTTSEGVKRATKVIERLAESPAMLADAGADVETWLKAQPDGDALAKQVAQKLDAAQIARAESQVEGVTPKQLEAQLKKNPWNQWAALGLAGHDANAGKLEAAAARLHAFGKPAMMIREVRQTLGQLSSALGKLDEADALLSGLLGARLPRFQKAAAEYDEASKTVQDALLGRLRSGDVPYKLQTELTSATDAQQREIIVKWVADEMEKSEDVKAKREAYLALGDVVPAALAAGGVKLRRAQSLAGAEREAMLSEAEHLFLAIRTEAEGQPEFKLGLGETYARLGKTKESEAELNGVLEMHKPELSLRVAQVYRDIGSPDRAKEVANQVYDLGQSPSKESAAVLLGVMFNGRGEDDESEKWFKRADQNEPFVRTSLLEIEAQRLLKAGKRTECAAKYSLVAKAHLQHASVMDIAAYNNAAIAHQARYMCSGDPQALVDAETTLEKAYRAKSDQPIVVQNFSDVLDGNGKRRVLGKRIDVRTFHLTTTDSDTLLGMLLDSPERDAVLADLNSDPGVRRGNDLAAQYEVLAPNSVAGYQRMMEIAYDKRDEAALASLLERVKHAKGLETSESARNHERFVKGELDDKLKQYSAATLAETDAVLAKAKTDAKTRAAALIIAAKARSGTALYSNDTESLAKARAEYEQAENLWPAMQTSNAILNLLIDEAGLAADSTAWIAARRERTAISAVAKLAADKSPLAAKIQSSKQWSEARALAQKDTGRPSVDELRFARLVGDSGLESKAKAVLDDKLQRLSYEIGAVLDPSSVGTTEDLAYLDKR